MSFAEWVARPIKVSRLLPHQSRDLKGLVMIRIRRVACSRLRWKDSYHGSAMDDG